MDTTAQGWPYPEESDAITDYPAVAQTLAEKLEAGTPYLSVAAFAALVPVDAQEVILVVDTETRWRLRYNAGSASAYKWEFLGGDDLDAEVTTPETTTSGTFVDLATVGPSITIPRAGEYDVFQAVTMSATAIMQQGAAILKNGAGAVQEDFYASIGSANTVSSVSRRSRKRTYAAGDVLKQQYAANGSASVATFRYRTLAVRPRRIS